MTLVREWDNLDITGWKTYTGAIYVLYVERFSYRVILQSRVENLSHMAFRNADVHLELFHITWMSCYIEISLYIPQQTPFTADL